MGFEEYKSRFEKILKDTGSNAVISEEELVKTYISQLVVSQWQTEEFKKEERKLRAMKRSVRPLTSEYL